MRQKTLFFIALALPLLLLGCGQTTEKTVEPEITPATAITIPNNQLAEAEKPAVKQDVKKIMTQTKVSLVTNQGTIKITMFDKEAPNTVKNFVTLAKRGFYDNTKFHRVIPNFMIQGGDPNSKDDDWSNDGTGGPGYQFADEFNDHKVVRGALAMANSGPNTNGSQFFIVTTLATPWLDGRHTVFGEVTEGMDIVDAISTTPRNENDHPLSNMMIEKVTIE